jgi:glycosyltransferase involved in cell wall biosynthesis
MLYIHIISNLNAGGAEIMLSRLVIHEKKNNSNILIISLTDIGSIGEVLTKNDIAVISLDIKNFIDLPKAFYKLFKIFNNNSKCTLYTWMYHANLIGGLAAKLNRIKSINWGIHSVSIPNSFFSLSFWLVRLCSILSYYIPNNIIYCAHSSKIYHENFLFYCKDKGIVINNGFDFSQYSKNYNIRFNTRTEIQVNNDTILIGLVARFDPLKDLKNFIKSSFIAINSCNKKLKFIIIGHGNNWNNTDLTKWIFAYNLESNYILIDHTDKIIDYYDALDIFCISSRSEAFPNVLIEAMAMSLPCVVTDVGDNALILPRSNYVVQPNNSSLLGKALVEMCNLSFEYRKQIGLNNRNSIIKKFNIVEIALKYKNLIYINNHE